MLHRFLVERSQRLNTMAEDREFSELSSHWMLVSFRHRYGYSFQWMGVPIIKYPADLIGIQEIVYKTRPEIIIETGVAFGGSLLFLASMLALLPSQGRVIGVEKKLLESTRTAIRRSPVANLIHLVEGNSTSSAVLDQVEKIAQGKKGLVILDSDHSADHVLQELRSYHRFVAPGSYLIAADTFIDILPGPIPGKAYGPDNNPMMAVHRFLKESKDFVSDRVLSRRLQCTEAPDGYLRRIAECEPDSALRHESDFA